MRRRAEGGGVGVGDVKEDEEGGRGGGMVWWVVGSGWREVEVDVEGGVRRRQLCGRGENVIRNGVAARIFGTASRRENSERRRGERRSKRRSALVLVLV